MWVHLPSGVFSDPETTRKVTENNGFWWKMGQNHTFSAISATRGPLWTLFCGWRCTPFRVFPDPGMIRKVTEMNGFWQEMGQITLFEPSRPREMPQTFPPRRCVFRVDDTKCSDHRKCPTREPQSPEGAYSASREAASLDDHPKGLIQNRPPFSGSILRKKKEEIPKG